MQNVVQFNNDKAQPETFHADVKTVAEGVCVIESEGMVLSAKVAFSCFLVPEVNDRVLVNRVSSDVYILAVLERDVEKSDQTSIEMNFPASLTMRTTAGDIKMVAQNDMRMSASGTSSLVSNNISMLGNSIDVVSDELHHRSATVESHTDQVKIFSKQIDTVADQIKQRVNSVIRWVEGVETLNIGNYIQNIRHTLTTHSTQVVLTAKKDIRVDGERIHMG